MSVDSINDEIRATRRKLASQFNNDLTAIIADIRSREKIDGRIYVTRSPRPAPQKSDEKTIPSEPRPHLS